MNKKGRLWGFKPINLDCAASPSLQKIPFMAALSLLTFRQLFYFVAAHLSRGTLSNSLSASKAYNFLCLSPLSFLAAASLQDSSELASHRLVQSGPRAGVRKQNRTVVYFNQAVLFGESSFSVILCSMYLQVIC